MFRKNKDSMTRILSSIENKILELRLESEDGIPRLEREILAEIEVHISRLGSAADLDGCVIGGGERAFAVGAEISELAALGPGDAFEFSRAGQSTFHTIASCRKPVIAAIQGYCMGGGLDLALACHERVASPDAVFAHPGGALGIITGWGGTQRLARIIGRARAHEMLATGMKLAADEALSFGLVGRIVSASHVWEAAVEHIDAHPSSRRPRP
jgi:enoyl-CoA hydratase